MELITREQALSEGRTRYFTGEPCKNGHICERYVSGYFCLLCVRGSSTSPNANPQPRQLTELQARRISIEQQKLEQRERRLKLHEAKLALSEKRIALRPRPKRQDLVPIRVILHFADVDIFKATMHATAMESDPYIVMADLLTNRAPESHGSRALHTFKCFQADFKGLHELARSMDAARVAGGQDEDLIAYRAEMRRRAEEEARLLDEEDNGRPQDITA